MSITVRDLALSLGVAPGLLVRTKQRIRDEIKRQGIKPSKKGNKFVLSDEDAASIVKALGKTELSGVNKKSSEVDVTEIIAVDARLQKEQQINDNLRNKIEDKDEEIRRLNKKIGEFADAFKLLNEKQLQLNNQQQQLQARILEQTEELKTTKKKLFDNNEEKEEVEEKLKKFEDKVKKIEDASLWQRIRKKY